MSHTNSLFAKLTVISLLVSPAGPLTGWQTVAAAPAQAKPAKTVKTVPPPDDAWPRAYVTVTGARVVLYQPQVGLWPDEKHMTAGAAVSYQAKDAQTPAVGTLKIEADTKVALDDRLVSFKDLRITQANFPSIPKDQLGAVIAEINAAIPQEDRVIGLDRVLAMVETSVINPRNADGIKADPPVIFFSETTSALVNFDGNPIWSPIPDSELKFAVNTNWDFFE